MKSLLLAALSLPLCFASCKGKAEVETPSFQAVSAVFNADSAYASIERQCAFGERVPGSKAHADCADYIVAQFKARGLDVMEQKADCKMWDGKTFGMRNIIAQYKPEATERVIICTHWESRPWADADKDSSQHRLPVMAANDGASGVGVMLEVARHLAEIKPNVGIDFICYDLEDYGAPYWETNPPQDGSDWCVGSRYWSQNPHKPGYTARYGILLDMVGGKDARFHFEGYSMKYASNVVAKVWDAANNLGFSNYFVSEEGGWVTDDHGPMNEIAGIPSIDIIAFSTDGFGKTWHTRQDTPENISKETLKAVGQTLLQVLAEEQ